MSLHCLRCGRPYEAADAAFCGGCGARRDAEALVRANPVVPGSGAGPNFGQVARLPRERGLLQGDGRPPSQAAVVSAAAGALAFVLFPFVGALVAIVAGHHARREIRRAGGALGGGQLASLGLWLGYGQLVLGCLALGLLFGLWAYLVSTLERALGA